jgi:hypothetical protein
MAFEHVSHRLVRNVVAEIRQGTGNAVVPPTAVLLSHPDNESFQRRIDSPAWRDSSALGSVELLGNEVPVPSQNGVGIGHAGHLVQTFAAESFPDLGERGSLQI